ncbi:MAG: holo-ACP synthase [Clostridiales bacterium]|jgi:holo-[acyl-carrier protein] synthase|nr:holo-ACP synthase [Clostridiales bacterium]
MIGIDIIKVQRIEDAAKKPAFLARVFTGAELDYYKTAGEKPETLAGLYALKEAAAKALGTGFRAFSLRDIEVTHDELGAPRVGFHGKAREVFAGTGAKAAECSISHEKEYAAAVCFLNGKHE